MKRTFIGIILIIVFVSFLLAGCDGSGGKDKDDVWITVFEDNFNRSDGDLGSNYTVETDVGASMQITGNTVMYNATGNDQRSSAFYKDIINDANSKFSIKFKTGSNLDIDHYALYARYTTGSEDGFGYAIGGDSVCFLLLRTDDDDGPVLAQEDITLETNTTYIIEFIIEGYSLTGFLKNSAGDVLSKLNATDSTYTTGKVMFETKSTGDTTMIFDDFKIETR